MSDENGSKASLTSGDSPAPDQDQPIFSFRFNKWKVLWRLGHLSLAILIAYKMVFDWALNKKNIFMFFTTEIVMGMLLIAAIFMLWDTIFTREIILYRTKIVKTWWFGLRREVEFSCARLGGMKTPFCSTKSFYPNWLSKFFTPFLGVFYDETLASNKDIHRMNQLLAEISGRDIGMFEAGGLLTTRDVSLKSFLKEGGANE